MNFYPQVASSDRNAFYLAKVRVESSNLFARSNL